MEDRGGGVMEGRGGCLDGVRASERLCYERVCYDRACESIL